MCIHLMQSVTILALVQVSSLVIEALNPLVLAVGGIDWKIIASINPRVRFISVLIGGQSHLAGANLSKGRVPWFSLLTFERFL